MPPKWKASPSTSSCRARSHQGKTYQAETEASTRCLADCWERLCRHDIPYFRGSHKVHVRGPSNTLFTTLLQSIHSSPHCSNLFSRSTTCLVRLYPCYHIAHSCQFCHLLPDKPTPLHKYIPVVTQPRGRPHHTIQASSRPRSQITRAHTTPVTRFGIIFLELTVTPVNSLDDKMDATINLMG